MQLIKSLFCWHGVDNRQRFIIISIICFVTFILLTNNLINHKSSLIITLLLCAAIYLFATKRRLNDANLKNRWSTISTASFIITGLITLFFIDIVAYWLLLLPAFSVLFILTYPSQGQNQYTYGYHGPIDLSDMQQGENVNSSIRKRVEPTMHGLNTSLHSSNESVYTAPIENAKHNYSPANNINQSKNSSHNRFDLGETIRLRLLSFKKPKLVLITVGFLLLLILSMMIINIAPQTPETTPKQMAKVDEPIVEFKHPITLPDDFTIMMSSDNGIVINWQAEVNKNQEIWTLASAKGDKSCKNIAFDRGQTIRPYSVSVIDSHYYAYFSPLDTKALMQNIAFKNKFSLCGFNFSLKGSQATLGKSNFYANLIEY